MENIDGEDESCSVCVCVCNWVACTEERVDERLGRKIYEFPEDGISTLEMHIESSSKRTS